MLLKTNSLLMVFLATTHNRNYIKINNNNNITNMLFAISPASTCVITYFLGSTLFLIIVHRIMFSYCAPMLLIMFSFICIIRRYHLLWVMGDVIIDFLSLIFCYLLSFYRLLISIY